MPSEVDNAGRAFRESVLVVRAGDRAGIVVTGQDRLSWLNGLVTCDLTKLEPGGAAYGLIVEKKGRIQTDLYAVPSHNGTALVLAVLASTRDAMMETLDHYLVMEDAELEAADLVFWQLHGPAAKELARGLGAAFAGTLDLPAARACAAAVVAVPAADADAFAARLAERAAAAGGVVADDATWEAVRIEQGVPRFGVEADATLYPQEASLEKLAVAFDKGCYLGQEVVYMLENRGHVKRKLVPLEVDGELPLEKGEAVTTADGAAVGDVKSSLVGPSGKPVAIAMIKWAQTTPGTELKVGGRSVRVRASGPA